MDDADKTQGQAGQVSNQQPPTRGVGTLVKERGLPVASSADSSVSEFIKPSGAERGIEVHPGLKEIGVKPAAPEFPKVGPAEQKVGIRESMPPVKTEPTGLVQIPMMEKEARERLKHEKPTASIAWVAALVVKYFKKIHHSLIQNSKFKRQK